MDLTKPTWADPEEVYQTLRKDIGNFASFDGLDYPWGKNGISVFPGDIRERTYRWIIPENAMMQQYDGIVDKVDRWCVGIGVQFEVVRFQKAKESLPTDPMDDDDSLESR
jgi:hypothetical protein